MSEALGRNLIYDPQTTIEVDEGRVRTEVTGPEGQCIVAWSTPAGARLEARMLDDCADQAEGREPPFARISLYLGRIEYRFARLAGGRWETPKGPTDNWAAVVRQLGDMVADIEHHLRGERP